MKITIDLHAIIASQATHLSKVGAYRTLLKQIEPPFIEALLKHTQGNQTQAAKIAGIHRKTLAAKLKRYNLVITQQVNIT